MALPLSGNQLKKLTTRLREGMETPEDLDALDEVLLYYQRVLDVAHADVQGLCDSIPGTEPMAPRVKTLKTLLEKLRRQPELHSIAQVRDLAGLRVVVDGTRTDQDLVVQQIADLFTGGDCRTKIIDRRLDPRAGYRAVHLEVRREGIPLEVQVRTSLQHGWAEIFEQAADILGRELRYLNPPPELGPNSEPGKAANYLVLMADAIDELERTVAENPDLAEPHSVAQVHSRMLTRMKEISSMLRRLP